MYETNNGFSFIDIVKCANNEVFSLPTVQRGFVWKPYQIENLWDSILRGYPIGAIVLSKNLDNNKYEILDGQQRLTAISLGFNQQIFRENLNSFKIFIDIAPIDWNEDRKYIFRVITKSHPWGYQNSDNTKPLTSENKRNAMDLYAQYLYDSDKVFDIFNDIKLEDYFPYDANLPIPFHFFTAKEGQVGLNTIIDNIKGWNLWEKIMPYFMKNLGINYENELIDIIKEKIKDSLDDGINNLFGVDSQKIPALYLNLKYYADKNSIHKNDKDEEKPDEIEKLFIRLNSGGTPLIGEELNYSILKSKIDVELQREIEKFCKKIIRPARFITLAYRLFQNQDISEVDTYTKIRIKPRQFQRAMDSNRLLDFKKFLIKLMEEEIDKKMNLLEYTNSILEYNKEQHYGLPYPIIRRITDSSPEIMFLLLYRIYIIRDRFPINGDENVNIHKSMIGIITMFLWFGKGENLRDHSKLLSNIWDLAHIQDKEKFWSSETLKKVIDNKVLIKIPTKKELEILNFLENDGVKSFTSIQEDFHSKTACGVFLKKIINNRDLILYAQRKFINDFFNIKEFYLDDTDVPFDWDHISPYKLVHNRPIQADNFKSWYSTIGNFRAWPYSLNRMDQADTPSTKLNPDLMNDQTNLKWKRFIESKGDIIKTEDNIKSKLLEWSFCEGNSDKSVENWDKCDANDFRIDKNQIIVYKLIRKRIYKILINWYENFDSLIPQGIETPN